MLGRFIQADKTIPETGSNQAYDRYAYVENNPILYADLNGLEKVIIFYAIYDDGSNSFEAAANTQYQQALDQGYAAEDILMVQISTDKEFFEAIENSELGEIEQIHVFTHSWGIDDGGKPLVGISVPGESDVVGSNYINADDLDERRKGLTNRFSEGSVINMYGFQTARGSFP